MAGPLAGIRVVELGQVSARSVCGQLLGDLGADVIEVEPPGTGDSRRQWDKSDGDGEQLWWSFAARGERSGADDLRTTHGEQLVPGSIARADVLVENFRPGTLGARRCTSCALTA